MTGITWLASYPKSGNTWVRSLLTNYLYGHTKPVSINQLVVGEYIASNRDMLDNVLGVEIADLTTEELEYYRPLAYELALREIKEPFFCKIHDAQIPTPSGNPVISKAATTRVIYIIRNPCDVAVSLSHFMGWSIDWTVQQMANPEFSLAASGPSLQIPQRISTWSQHVMSWVDASQLDVLVIRYEDLKFLPEKTFGELIQFCEIELDEDSLHRAIEFSSFKIMNSQEQTDGFRERPIRAKQFFREGEVGTWRKVLTDNHVNQLINDHRNVMQRFSYLGSNNGLGY